MKLDPFGWLERFASAHQLHRIIRICLAIIALGFLIRRIMEYPLYLVKPLWAVETLIFIALMVAFSGRKDPVSRSMGIKEILIPIVGALLPFGLLYSPPNPVVYQRPLLLKTIFWWMTVSAALTAWGMWTLRRSFSITVEARSVAAGGPYRWIRHPIYLGEISAGVAVMFWRYSLGNLFLFTLFATIQFARARWEEKKLANTFPDYSKLRENTWWFWTD